MQAARAGIAEWLARHAQRDVPPMSPGAAPPPWSYMSRLPHLVVANDPELNPSRIVDFVLDNAGLCSLVKDSFQPKERPMEPFAEAMFASFKLKSSATVKASNKRPLSATISAFLPAPSQAPPLPFLPSSAAATAAAPPVPPPEKRARFDTPPPLPPGGPPPLPPGLPPSAAASSAPPLPPGPPPGRPSLPPAPLFQQPGDEQPGEDDEFGHEDDEDVYGIDEVDVDTESTRSLQQELRKSIDNLIAVKWPKSVQKLAENFKHQMRYPSGNPFAVKLVRGQTTAVPDEYFDYVANPMDFITIKERVAQNKYLTIDSFIRDINLVADNAVSYNYIPGPLKIMAEHVKGAVEREAAKLKQRAR